MSKPNKSIETIIQDKMPEFAGEVAGLSIEQLNSRLSELAKSRELNSDAKEADEELENTRKLVSELGAPYRDAEKALKLKSKYLIKMISDKGGA